MFGKANRFFRNRRLAMQIEVLDQEAEVIRRGSEFIASEARAAVQARGAFLLAVSGGKNPWEMFRALADLDVPWPKLHIFQVDERVAPDGDPDRNLTHLKESLLEHAPLRPEQVHAMPVTQSDLKAAAAAYAQTLSKIAGSPAVLDMAHLGMGPDGHTASLVPGDPVLEVNDVDVALTGVYQNRRRMTLTYPMLNRSRRIFWLITGESKAEKLRLLRDGDPSIPSGRIRRERAFVLADRAAASQLEE
jgi:6-phosphogluconolactonase